MIRAAAPQPAASALDPAKAKQREQMKGAAQAFEAVFLRQMISSMRAAKLGDDILGSNASDQFRDMADARLADSMAERNTLGIADMLLKQFEGRVGTVPAGTPPMAPAGASRSGKVE